ncbi:MAG: Calx-beta domain-containing protein [Reyranellaceae bacterium]|uniref:Calx-beta domain-containing protein n=1 Tax=Reyranella sp. TaxID=1929291 RepID=UPI003785033B
MATINYVVGDNWGSGFIGNMTVAGAGQALQGWTIEFDAGFLITNIWGAEIVSHVGNHYVLRNLSYNASVPANGQVSFGFQASTSTGTTATNLAINGATTTPPPPVLPTLSIDDASVTEGNSGTTQITFTVKLSQAASGPVTVNYATADGTALAGSDYTARTGTLTFAVGETSKTIQITVAGDTAVESTESFTVGLSGAAGATIADGSAVGTITNDDVQAPPPTGGVGLAYTVTSNWGSGFNAAITVTAGSTAFNGWTIEFNSTANITNIWNAVIVSHVGDHYVVKNASWNGQVGAGQSTSFGFQATAGSAGTAATDFTVNGVAVGTDPALPSLSIADASVAEGDSGMRDLVFTVTLSKAASGTVSVAYATSNGTASAGSDYTAASGTVTFAAGETSKTIRVQVAGDTTVESNETLTLTLSAPSGTTVGKATATGTITNDDTAPLPTLAIGDTSFAEGSAATPGNGTFTVTLSVASASTVTVKYATADGTAVAGSDYSAQSGTLTFAPGETQKTIKITAIGDSTVEANETLSVLLSSAAGATIADGTGAGTITNDDAAPLPTLALGDASFAEGSAASPGSGTFTVTLSAASSSTVTVKYATTDGTAVAGSDYIAQSGTLTFAAGETQKTIKVTAIGDAAIEANETFSIALSSASGATIADGTGAGTIVNDDTAPPVTPSLSLADTSVVEGNPGGGSAAGGWLSTSGNQIVDSAGHSVQIAGVNWFGFESSTMAPHGLWTRGYKSMMDQMVSLGFNTIRLPFAGDALHSTGTPNGIDFSKNPDLQGLTALQIMDKIVDYAGQIGLKIILDHHRSDLGAGTSANGLWYDNNHSQAQWMADWQMLAARYAAKPQVIGADLHNEPYNGTWGGGGANDWALAAEQAGNAIHDVNANWLIFVEGIGTYQGTPYWWGGNLMGVKDRPIQLDVANKLVYSAHDYPNSVWPQPWFQGNDFPGNLPAKFDQMWGYIYKQNIAPVWIGEFGTKLVDPKDAPWLEAITSYLSGDLDNNGTKDIPAGKQGVSWTYWSWNPNSGDTGGILADDWNTPIQAKLAYLTPIQFDFGSDVSGGGATTATFVVTLSQAATSAITVDYHTVAGTAGATDFTGATGSVTFAPGETSKVIAIAITPDLLVEGNEAFSVVLTNAAGATIARATATGTIVDDDGATPPAAPTTSTTPTTPTMPPTDPSGDFSGTFAVTDSWSSGFNATVKVHNDGSAATSWQIAIDMPNQIADIWNAKILSHDATGYVIGNTTWNGTLAHDGETSFGFVASGALDAATVHVHAVDTTPASSGSSNPPATVDYATLFSPYIDMAMAVDADLSAISQASGIKNFTLAFVLASPQGIGWQGVGAITDDGLSNGSTILQQVHAIQSAGGTITISFGGAAGQEAALVAADAATLQAEYQSVIDRYGITSIDFDIEGAAVADLHSIALRDQAIVGLEAANPNLEVRFTLPVLPNGLDANGLSVLQHAKADGVRIDIVNIMAMDYGAAVDNGGQMGLNAINATKATELQLANLGITAKIGVTPMIGVNDVASEVFTQADAQALLDYAKTDPAIALLSMWSVARDNGNGAGSPWASPEYSGLAQQPFEFAGILKAFDVLA